MPTLNYANTPSATKFGFPDVVRELRNMPHGVAGPAPRDMVERANPDVVWQMMDAKGREWDDYTGTLDAVTQTVNKLAMRRGIELSDDLNQAIADKFSLVAGLVGMDRQEGLISQTEQTAFTRLVLNFSDDEVRAYLGDELTNDLRQDASASDEIADKVESFFGRWERLRRVAVNRDAYEASRQSVRSAAAIAVDRQEYLESLGVKSPDGRFLAALTPFNILTLTTISPEGTDAVLRNASDVFDEAAIRFPRLAEEMPDEILTIILRRGGSGTRQKFNKERLFAYLQKRQAALESTGDAHVAARLVGGKTVDDVWEHGQNAMYRARWSRSHHYRDSAKQLGGEHFAVEEFGPDLVQQMLGVVEKRDMGYDAMGAIDAVTGIVSNVKQFTTRGIFAEIDQGLADDLRRGISTRTAESMFVLNQRLGGDKDIDKPVKALDKLQEWSGGTVEMLEHGVPIKVHEAGDTMLFHFVNPATGEKYPGAIELTTHGKMPEDATERERYIKEGKGARISITYDEERRSEALSLKGAVRRRAMNGRLDKSTYFMSTGIVDPDAEHAEVSFDIGSAHADGASRVVAEVIGEARKIRGGYSYEEAKKLGLGPYTYDLIDQKRGDREVFADYVRALANKLIGRQEIYERARARRGMATMAIRATNTGSGKTAA